MFDGTLQVNLEMGVRKVKEMVVDVVGIRETGGSGLLLNNFAVVVVVTAVLVVAAPMVMVVGKGGGEGGNRETNPCIFVLYFCRKIQDVSRKY